jgi:hypothetical protein
MKLPVVGVSNNRMAFFLGRLAIVDDIPDSSNQTSLDACNVRLNEVDKTFG